MLEELLRSPLQMALGSLEGSWKERQTVPGGWFCSKRNTSLVPQLSSLKADPKTEFGQKTFIRATTPMREGAGPRLRQGKKLNYDSEDLAHSSVTSTVSRLGSCIGLERPDLSTPLPPVSRSRLPWEGHDPV